MICIKNVFSALIIAILLSLLLGYSANTTAPACVWEGTAPFCKGRCNKGFSPVKRNKKGDGKKCSTGTKVKCCLTSAVIIRGKGPLCQGKCKIGEERVSDETMGENGIKCQTGKAAVCVLRNKK